MESAIEGAYHHATTAGPEFHDFENTSRAAHDDIVG
jgi:hypothetical protein